MSYVLLENKSLLLKKQYLGFIFTWDSFAKQYLGFIFTWDSFVNPSLGEDPGVGVVREPRASDFPRFPVCAVKIVTHTNDPTL